MNLFRLLAQVRKEPEYVARNKLVLRFKEKTSYTDEELNEIFALKGMEPHVNPDAKAFTQKALAAPTLDDRFKLLRRVKGVGMKVASTILMVNNPHKYAELDEVSWNSLRTNFGFAAPEKDQNSDYSVQEYLLYLEALQSLADEYGMNVNDVQYVISRAGRE